jgi:transposase-like protein
MEERGVFVYQSSINRWAIRFLPLLEKAFRKHKRLVGGSWRMDETYIKVKAFGNISIVPLIRKVKPSTFF